MHEITGNDTVSVEEKDVDELFKSMDFSKFKHISSNISDFMISVSTAIKALEELEDKSFEKNLSLEECKYVLFRESVKYLNTLVD